MNFNVHMGNLGSTLLLLVCGTSFGMPSSIVQFILGINI